jgi:hypothetical protein
MSMKKLFSVLVLALAGVATGAQQEFASWKRVIETGKITAD